MALIITSTGGLSLFAGILLLGHIVGSYDLDRVLAASAAIRSHSLYTPTLLLILLGALTKSAQFPSHFWLPQAMAANFYQRVHAPTLGTTLGTTCVALASIIYFSALGSRVVAHELLIIVFVTVTTPISLMVLVRAAVAHEESENKGMPSRKVGNENR